MKYLNGTTTEYSTIVMEISLLQVYCDVDFVGDPQTRHSTTGYIIFYDYGL